MPAASQSQVHVCSLEQFESETPYDCIVSGLPLNNFSVELVEKIFAAYDRLLAPGGTLSYFEYMYVRPFRCLVSNQSEKTRLRALDRIMKQHLERERFNCSWVFMNLPPAWVQHLRKADR
jgi:phospholipid N-methyltransferase